MYIYIYKYKYIYVSTMCRNQMFVVNNPSFPTNLTPGTPYLIPET